MTLLSVPNKDSTSALGSMGALFLRDAPTGSHQRHADRMRLVGRKGRGILQHKRRLISIQ